MKNRIFFIFALLLVNMWACAQTEVPMIAMVISKDNFRDEELLVPKSIFEKAGYKVVIFSESMGKAHGMLGEVVNVSDTIDKLNPTEYKAVIFVGGSGSSAFWNNKTAHKIAKDTLANNRILGAICIAPVTLANAGVLKGKRATVWASEGAKLTKCGAKYTGSSVEVDGDIVTGDGPGAAEEFAGEILKLIK